MREAGEGMADSMQRAHVKQLNADISAFYDVLPDSSVQEDEA